MKKYKSLYKKMRQRAWQAENKARDLDAIVSDSKREAEYYKKRFREFGSNVETIDPTNNCYITQVKWETKPEPWGHYIVFNKGLLDYPDKDKVFKEMKDRIVYEIARGLLENNLVQIIIHTPKDGPMFNESTIGAKLYVVPWEQMPHKRTVELRQYVENSFAWMEGKDDGKR